MKAPHNEELEAAALGTVIITGHLGEAGELTADDFYHPLHRVVFEALMALIAAGSPIDVVLLWEQLRKTGDNKVADIEFINGLGDRGGHAVLGRQVEKLRRLGHERRVLQAAWDIAARAREGSDDFVEWAETRMLQATQATQNTSLAGPRQLTREFFLSLVRRSQGKEPVISTPYAELTAALGGGFKPGEVTVIAGRPAMGKTAFAMGLAQHAAIPAGRHVQDGRVLVPVTPSLFFSLEMTRQQLADRIFASEAPVDGTKLRNLQTIALNRDEEDALRAAGERLLLSGLYVDDHFSLSSSQISSRARLFCARRDLFPDGEHHLALIIVDHLGLIRSENVRGRTREQEVAADTRSLKCLAKELQVPVLVLCQLNRALEGRSNKRPQLSDLRESGAIEQDADAVLFVHREEYYHTPETPQAERDRWAGIAEIIIAKQRMGPQTTIETIFRRAIARFDAHARN